MDTLEKGRQYGYLPDGTKVLYQIEIGDRMTWISASAQACDKNL